MYWFIKKKPETSRVWLTYLLHNIYNSLYQCYVYPNEILNQICSLIYFTDVYLDALKTICAQVIKDL